MIETSSTLAHIGSVQSLREGTPGGTAPFSIVPKQRLRISRPRGRRTPRHKDLLALARQEHLVVVVIRRDLITLRAALRIAIARGLWKGSLDFIIPEEFKRALCAQRKRSPRRDEILKLLPHLSKNAAATIAFILATTAETAALKTVVRFDIPRTSM
jgi:hypothetical protein